MEILIIGVIFFVIALVVRRKEAFQFRWQPTRQWLSSAMPTASTQA